MSDDGDAALMEASLMAVADAGIDIRHLLFERFLAAYPERRPAFLNLDAASRRMTDETLQILFGLAAGEGWVWPLVAELVVTHRNYGALPADEYDAFVDLTIDELGRAAGTAWTVAHAAAWRRQGEALKAMIRRALAEWRSAMPGGAAAAPA
ncbi:globin [Sphingopyxis sp. GW247-27LB]|uniref:globin n=1 Tax=Sphingopyxis sp. GW247-27LB TaxID=2012632 RepID=UPI000BA602DA|nr:globin [Sphingopyxis sp. GW247-27LB]PAL22429.1 hypothetical protein CD928_10020 [Sphingopyxis sp. GW247-27LB]